MKKQSLTTDQLVILLLSRDEKGFNYLYDNYSSAFYGVIFRIVRYEEEANEVLQDTFIKVWNNIKSFDSQKGTLYTWMLNIARNSAIDRLKSKSFQNDLKNQSIPDFVDDNKSLTTEQKHEFGEVEKLVDTLRPDYSILIKKAYYGGFTQEEISDDLNIPLGTVKTRTRAALLELKGILKDFQFLLLLLLVK